MKINFKLFTPLEILATLSLLQSMRRLLSKLKLKPGRISSLTGLILILTFHFSLLTFNLVAAATINRPPLYLSSNNGLVGYWTFDGKDTPWTSATAATTVDKSGRGNTGTLTNMSQASSPAIGKIGQALNFDGVDDLVNAGSNTSLDDLGPMAVSAWIKPTSMGENSRGRIVDKSSGTGVTNFEPLNGWTLSLCSGVSCQDGSLTSAFIFRVDHDLIDTYRVSTSNSVLSNVWQHVVATWDGSTNASNIHIYVNGVEVSYGLTSSGIITRNTDNAQSLRVGNESNTASTFNGLIDEVRVYNRALSANEIQTLYKSGAAKIVKPTAITKTNLTSGGGAWGASHTTASISPGANRLVIAVIASGSFDLAQTTTLSGAGMTWVQVARVTSAGDNLILTVFRAMSAAPGSGAITITNSQNARSAWSFFELAGVDTSGTNGSGAIVQFATANGNSAAPSVTLASFSNMNNATIGGFGVGAFVNGDFFTAGTGFTKIHGLEEGTGNYVNVATEWRADNDTTVDGTISLGAAYWLAFGAEIKAKPKSTKINVSPTKYLTDGLVGYWTMDGSKVNWATGAVTDSSGKGNTGTITNMATSTGVAIGKIGQALNFDGVDDYVNIVDADDTKYTGALTICEWANIRTGSQFRHFAGKHISNGGTNNPFDFRTSNAAIPILVLARATATGNRVWGGSAVTLNSWRHYCVTAPSGEVNTAPTFYIDGKATIGVNSSGSGTGNATGAGANIRIGLRTDSVVLMDGLIDEVRVYNRALTPAEIQRLYNIGR